MGPSMIADLFRPLTAVQQFSTIRSWLSKRVNLGTESPTSWGYHHSSWVAARALPLINDAHQRLNGVVNDFTERLTAKYFVERMVDVTRTNWFINRLAISRNIETLSPNDFQKIPPITYAIVIWLAPLWGREFTTSVPFESAWHKRRAKALVSINCSSWR